MNLRGPLHEKLFTVRGALAPHRRTGIALSAEDVTLICTILSLCAIDAELLLHDHQRLLEQTDNKVVSLMRRRRAHPPGDGDNGGTAA